MIPEPIAYVLLAVFGLVMGSAVTALVHRVPRQLSWVRGRSACPSCEAPLAPRDLVPLLSFLLARGRCRHCGARIAWRYPLTELACAVWAMLLYLKVGPAWSFLPLAFWGFLLVALTWVDLDFQLLPDALTCPGTVLGIAAALLGPGPHHALLGVVAASGLLWLLAWAWLTFRKVEGMGGGDIKLAAMFGAVLGWPLAFVTLFLAALAGSVWGGTLIALRRGGGKTALPFGALLAPAAMVVFLWGDRWVNAYLSLFRHR
ncbi:MAG: prepilin peptidase [Candidatus Eisenbacteria bacterium]|nr:prepilin peptidase [Candidatus Eisenbacteria bacterium]